MTHPRLVGDRFEIQSHAGRGGVGDVYLAVDRQTGQNVAVKLVRSASDKGLARFTREAQMLAILNHPGIVQYIDHGTTESGAPYLVMEWIEGESLDKRLRRGKLSLAEAVKVTLGVAKAVRVAHWRGIVHRDIKPSNLYLAGGDLGRVKVLDFGIARMLSTEVTPLTESGTALGSPGYMSPEQARGATNVDSRADVFSIGSVLFHCLTGRAPFVGDSAVSLILRVVLDQPPRVRELVPSLPSSVDALVARLLSKEPDDRPQNAAQIVDELEALDREGASDAASAPRPSLTTTERRMVCALLAHTHVGTSGTLKEGPDSVTPPSREDAERHLDAVLKQFGATVDILQGGLYLATFPHSKNTPDVARKAARAALALTDVAPHAAVSLAIHRIEGEGRSELGTALGQLVETLRRPGIVHVDEPTSGLLATDFEIDRDRDGFFLVCERDAAEVGRNVLGRAVLLVGRKRELAALAEAAREAWSRPKASAAMVIGAQGSGKSRLRHELVARTRAAIPNMAIWIGRGDAMASDVPMSVLAPIIRRAALVQPGEAAELSRHKLATRVSRSLQGDAFVRTTAFLGELIGARFPPSHSVELSAARENPQIMSDLIRRAIIEFARGETAQGPLLLVLEDLHWADLASVEVVERLLSELASAPVFVLGTALPGVGSRFPERWPDRAPVNLELGPLSAPECRDLARHVLGGAAPSAQVETAIARSAGNPLFLEELLRAVASNRDLTLPGAILAMVESRLGDLSPDLRRAVRAASVFGQVFWRGGVIELLGGDQHVSTVDGALAELVRRELCVRCRHSRIAGEDEYAFRHSVIRDAAYEMLTDEDQRLGHRLAGAWLSRKWGVAPALLADHFERGGDHASAIEAYANAAEAALRNSDSAGANRLVERGMALGATGPALGALFAAQVEALAWRGHQEDLIERGTRALDLLPRGSVLWCRVMQRMNRVYGFAGQVPALLRATDELAVVLRDNPTVGAISAILVAAFFLFQAGEHERARTAVLGVLEAIRKEPLASAQATTPLLRGYDHWGRALLQMVDGDPSVYGIHTAHAVAAFEESGDLRLATVTRANLANANLRMGFFEEAEVIARKALAHAIELGQISVVSGIKCNLMKALAGQGRLDEALVFGRASCEEAAAIGERRVEGESSSDLAMLHLARGEAAAALRCASRAATLLADQPTLACKANAVKARAELATGDRTAAMRNALSALQVLGEHGAVVGDVLIRLTYAEALDATGDRAGARAALLVAREKIQAKAAVISDPTWRSCFLERVFENARVEQLLRAW